MLWVGRPRMPVQKEQVQVDMPTMTRTSAVEHMLESADPLIELHRESSGAVQSDSLIPQLPQGWILYSAQLELGSARKGWNVELLDTSRPFQKGSIVEARHSRSLDAALQAASRKVPAARIAGAA